jgi:hypothetical protein
MARFKLMVRACRLLRARGFSKPLLAMLLLLVVVVVVVDVAGVEEEEEEDPSEDLDEDPVDADT